MTYRKAQNSDDSEKIFQNILADEAMLVLRRCEGRTFQLLGEAPSWALAFAPSALSQRIPFSPSEHFAFLDHFLEDAEEAWSSPAAPAVASGIWTESFPHGGEVSLTARAHRLEDYEVMVIRSLGVDFEERRQLLQRGREMMLSHERLRKETSKKEALLHCLVHDVSGPLTAITSSLYLLDREPGVSPSGHELLRIAGSESDRMQEMLKEVMDLFTAELAEIESYSDDLKTAPDLLESVSLVLKQLSPNMTLKNVTHRLVLMPEKRHVSWKVAGQAEQLARVLHNLLENAIRHTPLDSAISVLLTEEPESIHVAIEDEGPGLEPAMAGFLFQRLRQGADKRGKAGLGLFFCRMTIERWGGRIGHDRGTNGGARFWFRLPRPKNAHSLTSEKLDI